ncbi:MAG: hypothetical protein NC231_10060 [Bacillus sp. (in: Bacteria)]|nr:hypothetical protein [Bacillus sp. (in: firmicutes)]MCM1426074.1 hypothetical protein [Eubacterium sp.]
MRCEFCGAQIKEGESVCEYCGSTVERTTPKEQTIVKNDTKQTKGVIHMILKVIVVLACVWAAVIVISLIVVLNSDVFKETYSASTAADSGRKLPYSQKELTGTIISCGDSGTASIEYEGGIYEDVKILDEALLAWLRDRGRTLDTVGICFATDENGDISELGLLSADFFVVENENGRYIAVRDEDIISFTSEMPLEAGGYYGGYFSYPDMGLYTAKKQTPLSTSYMDAECEDKESLVTKEYYTQEEVSVYRILVNGDWYYCSKEVYDDIQTGDLLDGYAIYPNQTPAFIAKQQRM